MAPGDKSTNWCSNRKHLVSWAEFKAENVSGDRNFSVSLSEQTTAGHLLCSATIKPLTL